MSLAVGFNLFYGMGASYFVSKIINDKEALKTIDEEISRSHKKLKKISEEKRLIKNEINKKSTWDQQNIVVKFLLIFGAISQAIVF